MIEEKVKKPKCFGCGEIGMEQYYYWHQPHHAEGHLWHAKCWVETGSVIRENIKRSIKINQHENK